MARRPRRELIQHNGQAGRCTTVPQLAPPRAAEGNNGARTNGAKPWTWKARRRPSVGGGIPPDGPLRRAKRLTAAGTTVKLRGSPARAVVAAKRADSPSSSGRERVERARQAHTAGLVLLRVPVRAEGRERRAQTKGWAKSQAQKMAGASSAYGQR